MAADEESSRPPVGEPARPAPTPPFSEARRRRVGADDLRKLTSRVWGAATDGASVTTTKGPVPRGHRPVERYAVVPSRRAPRYLLPLDSRKAVSAAFSRYLATSSRRGQLQGRMLGALWASGLGELLARDRFTVAVPDDLPEGEMSDRLLITHLAELLGADDLVAAWPVRPAMPSTKPTARLLDRNGTPVGYLKLGWSPATRELVRNETRVLRELGGQVGELQIPRVLVAGSWSHHTFLVTSPLVPLRPITTAPESWPDVVLGIAYSGTVEEGALSTSTWRADVETRLDACDSAQPAIVGLLRRYLQQVTAADPWLVYGRWHGDLVPWNLGLKRGNLVAWDWEYSSETAPVGFDLLHWHFQTALASPRASLHEGVRAVDAALDSLPVLGVGPDDAPQVADCYLLEMLTRATGLAVRGAGWNPKIRASMEAVVRSRLEGESDPSR